MRRVFSSHFINHFNHKAVSALLMLCKQGPTVRPQEYTDPRARRSWISFNIKSKSQVRDGYLMQVQQDEH